jgi:2-oxoglutarate ferredoxin oxidoreductase subunit beta
MVRKEDFKARMKIDWCPGCGNFGILNSIKEALVDLELGPDQVVVVSGIGNSAKLPHFMNANGFHALHGRALPVATGIKLANSGLKVIAVTGDGDGLGIGGAHFIHTIRRNIDIVHILNDNQIYGLTTGQIAPTSDFGMKTKTTPRGNPEQPVKPGFLALASGATFVARTFVGRFEHAQEMIRRAIRHKGYALVDVLQPCVIFNKVNTYEFFDERVYDIAEEGHDPSDLDEALRCAREWGDRIPIGVFYQTERPTLDEELVGLTKGPLALRDISHVDISASLKEFD